MRKTYSILLLLFLFFQGHAQRVFEIAIISDAAEQENHNFEEGIKAEITALLASQYELNFMEIYTSGDINTITDAIATIYSNN